MCELCPNMKIILQNKVYTPYSLLKSDKSFYDKEMVFFKESDIIFNNFIKSLKNDYVLFSYLGKEIKMYPKFFNYQDYRRLKNEKTVHYQDFNIEESDLFCFIYHGFLAKKLLYLILPQDLTLTYKKFKPILYGSFYFNNIQKGVLKINKIKNSEKFTYYYWRKTLNKLLKQDRITYHTVPLFASLYHDMSKNIPLPKGTILYKGSNGNFNLERKGFTSFTLNRNDLKNFPIILRLKINVEGISALDFSHFRKIPSGSNKIFLENQITFCLGDKEEKNGIIIQDIKVCRIFATFTLKVLEKELNGSFETFLKKFENKNILFFLKSGKYLFFKKDFPKKMIQNNLTFNTANVKFMNNFQNSKPFSIASIIGIEFYYNYLFEDLKYIEILEDFADDIFLKYLPDEDYYNNYFVKFDQQV